LDESKRRIENDRFIKRARAIKRCVPQNASGHPSDVRRLGIGVLLLTTVVFLLTIPYWGLLGLPLKLR
jgi:hypothetical protein